MTYHMSERLRPIFALVFLTIGAATLGADKPQVEIVIDRSDIPSVGAIDEHAVRGFVSTMLVCHETCGLDMEAFQKTIAKLQANSAGTDLEALGKLYVNAARCSHDIKARPSKYISSDTTAQSEYVRISAAGASFGPAKVVKGTIEYGRDSMHNLIKVVEQSGNTTVPVETQQAIQVAEDEAFTAVIGALKKQGFFLQPRSAFVGSWRYRWGTIGHVDFTLKHDGTFEAILYRDKPDESFFEGLSNWGAGNWDVKDGLLTVDMKRVGRTGIPGSVAHELTWFHAAKVIYVDSENIVLSGDRKLTRQQK